MLHHNSHKDEERHGQQHFVPDGAAENAVRQGADIGHVEHAQGPAEQGEHKPGAGQGESHRKAQHQEDAGDGEHQKVENFR